MPACLCGPKVSTDVGFRGWISILVSASKCKNLRERALTKIINRKGKICVSWMGNLNEGLLFVLNT